jgi:hypothetical protein
MIKICYKELSQVNFQRAWGKLMNVPMKTPEAFRIKHIGKDLQVYSKEMQEDYKKLLKEYAKGGVQTPPVTDLCESLGLPFEAEDGKAESAKAALDKFGNIECHINQKPLTGEFLLSVSDWTPLELQALEPVLVPLTVA